MPGTGRYIALHDDSGEVGCPSSFVEGADVVGDETAELAERLPGTIGEVVVRLACLNGRRGVGTPDDRDQGCQLAVDRDRTHQAGTVVRLRVDQATDDPVDVALQEAAQLAPSFRLTGERLREDWLVDWMKDPQSITPGTQMPQFWPPLDDGTGYMTPLPDVLGGDAEAQMRAVAAYLMRYAE